MEGSMTTLTGPSLKKFFGRTTFPVRLVHYQILNYVELMKYHPVTAVLLDWAVLSQARANSINQNINIYHVIIEKVLSLWDHYFYSLSFGLNDMISLVKFPPVQVWLYIYTHTWYTRVYTVAIKCVTEVRYFWDFKCWSINVVQLDYYTAN